MELTLTTSDGDSFIVVVSAHCSSMLAGLMSVCVIEILCRSATGKSNDNVTVFV